MILHKGQKWESKRSGIVYTVTTANKNGWTLMYPKELEREHLQRKDLTMGSFPSYLWFYGNKPSDYLKENFTLLDNE